MKPTVDLEAPKKATAWDYAVRFLFGGAVSASAGLVTHAWGPVVGGLFLAFPAILPASLTLVKEHDGRAQAADDARGGVVGSVGLGGFAGTVWLLARLKPFVLTLGLATIAWLAVSAGIWWMLYRSERER
jgi:hypothetical protein